MFPGALPTTNDISILSMAPQLRRLLIDSCIYFARTAAYKSSPSCTMVHRGGAHPAPVHVKDIITQASTRSLTQVFSITYSRTAFVSISVELWISSILTIQYVQPR